MCDCGVFDKIVFSLSGMCAQYDGSEGLGWVYTYMYMCEAVLCKTTLLDGLICACV